MSKREWFNVTGNPAKGTRTVSYQYRENDQIFSCLAKSVKEARAKRDEWLNAIPGDPRIDGTDWAAGNPADYGDS